jgi:hypothetical protein
MRARDREVPGAPFGLAHDLVGIGHGDDEKSERMRRRLAELPEGTFVWTRDPAGWFHLGRVAGPYRRERSAAARAAGIVHVRPTRWLDRPFGDDEVPARVAYAFARGGRNLQRIRDDEAERRTAALWDERVR